MKLSAVCMYCSKDAPFTQRTVDNNEVELIGGEEAYRPTCRKCFNAANVARKGNSMACEEPQLQVNPEVEVEVTI